MFAIPFLQKEHNGISTELAITVLVPRPGFTEFAIFISDQNGLSGFQRNVVGLTRHARDGPGSTLRYHVWSQPGRPPT